MAKGNAQKKTSDSTATIGFEAKLWLAADKLRNNMDAAGFASPKSKLRDRRTQTLFIDARKLVTLIDRVHRELTDADLQKIVSTYHAWRGQPDAAFNPSAAKYADTAGFCKSATTIETAAYGRVLTPGRYVGAEEVEDDGEPFELKMPRLVAEQEAQFAESAKLQNAIRQNLKLVCA